MKVIRWKRWSAKEVATLQRLAGKKKVSDIATALRRTVGSVNHQAFNMRLSLDIRQNNNPPLRSPVARQTSEKHNMKTVYLWIVDFGLVQLEHYPKPYRNIDASLFFSSAEKFYELYPWDDRDQQQLVPVQVPDDFDHLDFIPDNY